MGVIRSSAIWTINFSQHHLLKMFSFFQPMFLASLSNIKCLKLDVLMFWILILFLWLTCLFCANILFLLLFNIS